MYKNPYKYDWSDFTILIVEDDHISDCYFTEIFRDTQVKLLHASNGREAVDIFKTNPSVSLILMDIKMPVMSGLDATRIIRQLNPDIPIIAQSADALYSNRIECLAAGCNDFISKPIDSVEMLLVMDAYFT